MIKKILYPLRRIHRYLYVKKIEFTLGKSLRKYKNIHKGQRCFVIGNGPSLKVEDLERIKDEISFGTHRVYHIFEHTNWRPFYYCAQDQKLINEILLEIEKIDATTKFVAYCNPFSLWNAKGIEKVKLINEAFYPCLPKFSQNICKGVYEGFTVTYMCIQIAVYMGFTEIILLGVDHAYSVDLTPSGKVLVNKEVKDHFSDKDQITNVPQTYKSSLAYEAAEKYSKKIGVKILNATRGGALKAFECIDFDKWLNKYKEN